MCLAFGLHPAFPDLYFGLSLYETQLKERPPSHQSFLQCSAAPAVQWEKVAERETGLQHHRTPPRHGLHSPIPAVAACVIVGVIGKVPPRWEVYQQTRRPGSNTLHQTFPKGPCERRGLHANLAVAALLICDSLDGR